MPTVGNKDRRLTGRKSVSMPMRTLFCLGLFWLGSGASASAAPVAEIDANADPKSGVVAIGDKVTSKLDARVKKSPPNVEALVLTLKWNWSATVKYRAKYSDLLPTENDPYTPLIDKSTDKSPTLTATFPRPGYWTVNLTVTATWFDGTTVFATAPATVVLNFTVVGVDTIIVDGSEPPRGGSTSVCVGTGVTLRALPIPADAMFPDGKPTWTIDIPPGGSAKLSTNSGATTTVTPSKPGEYKVTATCGTTSASCFVKAVEVAAVVIDGKPGSKSPELIALGDSVKLRATKNPIGTSFPPGKPMWKILSKPKDSKLLDPDHGSDTVTIKPDVTGSYVIQAGDCGSAKEFEITAVAVDRIQYKDPDKGWLDCTESPLWVGQSVSLTLRAVPRGADKFPPGKPIWAGTVKRTQPGSPTADLFTLFASASRDAPYEVTASCGNEVSALFVIWTLKGVWDAQIRFPNRSQSRFGLGEKVDLLSRITPPPYNRSVLGKLKWKGKKGGNGKLTDPTTDGSAVWETAIEAGTGELTLEVTSGVSKGMSAGPYILEVIAPTGGHLVQSGKTFKVWHEPLKASAGFKASIVLDPQDVAFDNLTVREGPIDDNKTVATGSMAPLPGFKPNIKHPQTPFPIKTYRVFSPPTTSGWQINYADTVDRVSVGDGFLGPAIPRAGSLSFSFDWQYQGTKGWIPFQPITQTQSYAANGSATVTKLAITATAPFGVVPGTTSDWDKINSVD